MSNFACPMNSDETLDLLLDYTAHRLDAARIGLLERHMTVCAACARFRDEQSSLWTALDLWEPAPVSTDFNRRLWHRIDLESDAPWFTATGWRSLLSRLRKSSWQPAIPLSAVVLIVMFGFMLDHPSRKGFPQSIAGASVSSAVRVTDSEADQVQRTLDDIQLLNQFEPAVEGEKSPNRM